MTTDKSNETVSQVAAQVEQIPKIMSAPEPKPECPVSELRLYTSQVNVFVHEVEHGVTLDDVLRPQYWKHVWRQLARSKWTEVNAIAIDGTWEARLRVIAAGEGFAKVRVLSHWQAERKNGKTGLPAKWDLQFVAGGWRVKNADGEVITERHPTESEAIETARKLMARMGAA